VLRSTDVRTRDGQPVRERVVTAHWDPDHTHDTHHTYDADDGIPVVGSTP
jgi:hypothetical protein